MCQQAKQSKGRILILGHLRIRKIFRPERDKKRANKKEG
jgi:hypothetical protein